MFFFLIIYMMNWYYSIYMDYYIDIIEGIFLILIISNKQFEFKDKIFTDFRLMNINEYFRLEKYKYIGYFNRIYY